METNDQALATFQGKFQTHFGGPLPPGIWQAILAALMQMLVGCLPVAANIKTQIKRPLIQARLYMRLMSAGVPLRYCGQAATATMNTINGSTDEEIVKYVTAAQENE
jgi:hypothetical protein